MMMDVGALDLEMKPSECYQEEDPDLKRLRSDESVVDGEKLINKTPRLLGDVDDDDGSNPKSNPDDCDNDDDDEEEEKLRLKQKEKDAIAAAMFADFCRYSDEHSTVYTHDTYPDRIVDIKQREKEELEELEELRKLHNASDCDDVEVCPICKKEKYNCNHYHYNARWKSYSLKHCFICKTRGQHYALDCPDLSKYDKSIHPICGGRI